jgi:hypothetical protein
VTLTDRIHPLIYISASWYDHGKTLFEQVALQTSDASSLRPNFNRSSSPRRVALWLFASFQFFYLLTSTGRVRTSDEYNTLYTTESLVLRHSTAVPQAVELHNFYGRVDVHGQPRAAYPPGQALLCTPWYALGQYVIAKLPGVPVEDADLIVAFTSCLSSATFAALTGTFFFLMLMESGIPLRPSLIATAMLGLATPIFAYSAYLFSEPLSTAIFTGAAWLLFVRDKDSASLHSAVIVGIVLGLATIVRPTNVLAIAVFGLTLVAQSPGKTGLRAAFALGAASTVGVGILLAHNTVLFGGPLTFGYPKAAEGAKPLNGFNTPLLTGLYGFLLSPGKSVFIFAPPIILALLGLRALWQRNRGLAALAVLFPLIELGFYATYSQWEGGYCVGPRYLVPSLVLLCLGLGPTLAEDRPWIKPLAIVLFIAGFLVQVLSIATSFMQDQVPRGRYYDANWNYQLSYSLNGPAHLFFRYLASSEPAKLGLGWDRWFVFLAKGGVAHGTLVVLGISIAMGMIVSLWQLVRNVDALGRVDHSRSLSD